MVACNDKIKEKISAWDIIKFPRINTNKIEEDKLPKYGWYLYNDKLPITMTYILEKIKNSEKYRKSDGKNYI